MRSTWSRWSLIALAAVSIAAGGLSLAADQPLNAASLCGINCPPPPDRQAPDGVPLCGTYNTPPCPAATAVLAGNPPVIDD
jgi:hypothetical protein